MRIETERLLLRTPRGEDAPAMLEIRNSAYVRRYNPMKPWDLPRMEKEVEEDAKSGTVLYIDEKTTGRLVGGLWLEDDALRYGPRSYTLSYYLAESAAGKGYMTEALTTALPYVFDSLGADVLAARVFTPNTASARLLRKLGFTHEGTLRRAVLADGVLYDDMLFSLLPDEAER